MDKQIALVLLIVSAVFLGCGASTSVPRTAGDKQIEIQVLFDQGSPGKGVLRGRVPTEATQEERGELVTWMERDLISALTRRGYVAKTLKTLDEYSQGERTCLLSINLESYVPADRASRLEAGLGEGSTTVDVRYELFVGRGSEQRRLFTNERSRTSARGWQWIAEELNGTIADDVTTRLKKVLQ